MEICRQIAEGLKVIQHEHAITHRDVKLDNILIKNGILKLNDFGISKFEDPKSSSNGIQNHTIMAPETIIYGIKGFPVDVWALGLIIHELIFKRHPFRKEGAHFNSISGSVVYIPYSIPDQPVISEECKSLLRSCLEKDPALRITILGFLDHSCFSRSLGNPKIEVDE